MENTNESNIQVKFVTKQDIYSIPDDTLVVSLAADTAALNNLVNLLLREYDPSNYLKPIEFDFLIENELLRLPLNEFLKDRSCLDTVFEIEYIERTPAPEPQESILNDDWVSSVQTTDKWILAACYDNSVSIWTHHGKPVLSNRKHTEIVKDVTWIDPNNFSKGFVSVSHDQTGIIWEWEEGTNNAMPKIQLRGHERGVDCVGVSNNGARLATGGWDTNLKIWSASMDADDTGEPLSKKPKSAAHNLTVRTPLHTLQGHKETISSVIWTDNHSVCTASMDHTIKFWDCELYGISNEIVDQKAFLSASWSPLTKTLLASSADRHIRLYDPRSTEGARCKTKFSSHTLWVSSVTWSKYNEYLFLSGGYDADVKMWDSRSPNAPLYNLQGHKGQVLTVDWSNNKYLVSGGTDNSIHIFKNKDHSA